jgi:adenylylsulfate kinase
MGDMVKEVYIHTSEVRGRENFFVEDYEPPTENYTDICTDNILVDECINKLFSPSLK